MASAQTSESNFEPTSSGEVCTESDAEGAMQSCDLQNRICLRVRPEVKSTADIERFSNIHCGISRISDPLTVLDKQLKTELPNSRRKRLCIHSLSIEDLNTDSSSVSLKRSTSWPSGRFVVSSEMQWEGSAVSEFSWSDPLSESSELEMNSIAGILRDFEELVLQNCSSEEATDFVKEFLPSLSEPLFIFVMRHSYRVPPRFREVYSKFEESTGPLGSFHHRLFNYRHNQRVLKLSYTHGDWQPDGECVVCYRVNGGLARTCCHHMICESCLTQYFHHMVENEGRAQITCPACQTFCQREEVTSHLSQATKDKFYRFLYANNDANKKTCPQCSFITERPKRSSTRHEKKYGLNITCEVCSLNWCFNCHAPSHTMSCKKFIAGNGLFRQWTKEMIDGPNSSRNARRCPGCQIFIQRSEGCNHMHCSRCNTGFCYACGCKMRSSPLLGGHDNRISVLGCKRLLYPEHPHLRRFVRGSLLGVGIAVSPIVLVGACVGGIGFGIFFGSKLIVKKTKQRMRRRARQHISEIHIEHLHYYGSTDDTNTFRDDSTVNDYEEDAFEYPMVRLERLLSPYDANDESQQSIRQGVESGSIRTQTNVMPDEQIGRISSSDYLTSL